MFFTCKINSHLHFPSNKTLSSCGLLKKLSRGLLKETLTNVMVRKCHNVFRNLDNGLAMDIILSLLINTPGEPEHRTRRFLLEMTKRRHFGNVQSMLAFYFLYPSPPNVRPAPTPHNVRPSYCSSSSRVANDLLAPTSDEPSSNAPATAHPNSHHVSLSHNQLTRDARDTSDSRL